MRSLEYEGMLTLLQYFSSFFTVFGCPPGQPFTVRATGISCMTATSPRPDYVRILSNNTENSIKPGQ